MIFFLIIDNFILPPSLSIGNANKYDMPWMTVLNLVTILVTENLSSDIKYIFTYDVVMSYNLSNHKKLGI